MKGIGEAREEEEGGGVGEDETGEISGSGDFESWEGEFGKEDEAYGEEDAAGEAEFKKKSGVFVLDDFFGGGDEAFFVEDGAGGGKARAEELVVLPRGEGEVGEVDADLGGFGDVAVEG